MKQPSIKQCRARMLDVHAHILRRKLAKQPLTEDRSIGTWRGLSTALSTLSRWDCLDAEGVTERGKELLAAWDERHPRPREPSR